MDPISDVGSFVGALRNLDPAGFTSPFWFRGHKDASYRLQAGARRDPSFQPHELAMLKKFMQDARPMLGEAPKDHWEWLLLAQHHGVPTRLLDWSENALVGLFFACELDDDKLPGMPEPNGDVWVLVPERLNKESGTWSPQHPQDLPFLGFDETLDRYSPMVPSVPQASLRHVAAIGSRTFPRILNQWGTFTIAGESTAIEDLPNAEKFVTRIPIDGAAKPQILQELRSLGIEERVVYPDLHRLGRRVKELFS